jgi:serine protease Do
MNKVRFIIIVLISFFLVGCNFTKVTTNQTEEFISSEMIVEEDDLSITLNYIYELAVETGDFDGTYGEWLETVRGEQGLPGIDGREVQLQVVDGFIQWKYDGDSTWINLIDITTINNTELENLIDQVSYLETQISVLETQIENITNQIEESDIQSRLTNLLADANNSVVGIKVYEDGEQTSSGSGVIYKKIGDTYYVATNYHVVENYESLKVYLPNNSEELAYLVGFDYYLDLAVVKFNSNADFSISTFGDSNLAKPGDFIIAIGSPMGTLNFNSTTFGIVSGVNRLLYDDLDMYYGELYIQHDAPINPGNSGGPLYNLDGEVIGINTAKFVDTSIEGMGFAIPSNAIVNVLKYIEVGDPFERAGLWYDWLTNINAIRNNPLDYPNYYVPSNVINGVYVDNPSTDGIFGIAGIQDGDIILMIDGINVSFWYEVEHQVFYQHTKDDDIVFTVYRNNQVLNLVYNHTEYIDGYYSYQEVNYTEGDYYIGEIYDGYRHGYGVYIWTSGSFYIGDFYFNDLHGEGLIFYSNGDMYFGGFFYNEFYGEGTYYFADGDYYEGDWIDSSNSSSGIYYYANGTSVLATYVDGVLVTNQVTIISEAGYLYADGYIYYEFVLTENATIIAYTTGDTDTYGYLTDSSYNVITSDDDSGDGFNFSISYTLSPGTYYVVVSGYDEYEVGNYYITVVKS